MEHGSGSLTRLAQASRSYHPCRWNPTRFSEIQYTRPRLLPQTPLYPLPPPSSWTPWKQGEGPQQRTRVLAAYSLDYARILEQERWKTLYSISLFPPLSSFTICSILLDSFQIDQWILTRFRFRWNSRSYLFSYIVEDTYVVGNIAGKRDGKRKSGWCKKNGCGLLIGTKRGADAVMHVRIYMENAYWFKSCYCVNLPRTRRWRKEQRIRI